MITIVTLSKHYALPQREGHLHGQRAIIRIPTSHTSEHAKHTHTHTHTHTLLVSHTHTHPLLVTHTHTHTLSQQSSTVTAPLSVSFCPSQQSSVCACVCVCVCVCERVYVRGGVKY